MSKSGQCQFAAVAAALTHGGCMLSTSEFRADLDLRQLALHAISHNKEEYKDFLMVVSVFVESVSVSMSV